ncbi:MAG TPA: RNA polymerase sigma factor [Dehalococcoidia bacterium]|nr:RNA polymerase sigma factor [Dehalococcoidia bacterium]
MATVISLEKERVEQLSSQAADGNRDAFGALYDRYHDELLCYARRRVPTPEDAEDLGEQAFYKALRAIGKKDPRSPFNVWLFHITKNLITDFYRTRKQHEAIEDEASTTKSVEDEVLGRKVGGRLGELLATLTERQREVIELRFVEGLEYPEIAGRLGCGAGAVRIAQMRGLRTLRAALVEESLKAS